MAKRLKVGDKVHIHDRSWSASVVNGKTVYKCVILSPNDAGAKHTVSNTPCVVEEFGKGFPTERKRFLDEGNYTKKEVPDNSIRLSVPDMPGVIIYTRRAHLKFKSRRTL